MNVRMRALAGIVPAVVVASALAPTAAVAKTPMTKPMTRIVIAVSNCNGCRVSFTPGDEFNRPDLSTAPKRVRHGKVTFIEPTADILGLIIGVDDPGAVDTNARTFAVVRYRGQASGATIGAKRAAFEKRGFPCTAGTTKRVVHWRLKVDHFRAQDIGTKAWGYADRVYGSPGIARYGKAVRLWHGSLEMNGDTYCSQP